MEESAPLTAAAPAAARRASWRWAGWAICASAVLLASRQGIAGATFETPTGALDAAADGPAPSSAAPGSSSSAPASSPAALAA